MSRPAIARRKFLARYLQEYPEHKRRAEIAVNLVRSLLDDPRLDIHKIEARAKDPQSTHLKLLRKRYENPTEQLTDKIGVRVITYYAVDVDRVVDKLKSHFVIDHRRSVDKRRVLGTRSFGYSSVHLVVRLKERSARKAEHSALSRIWLEIQVRSILEHAWAEIEHEVVFKSAINYPESVDRRFAAVAGALEMLANEFHGLRSERNKLIESYRERYRRKLDNKKSFDAARLLGFLEAYRPSNLSWRKAEEEGRPFPPRIEATCVAALKACKLNTANALHTFMQTAEYRKVTRQFAAAQLEEPTHLALVVIAVARRAPGIFQDYFGSMSEDLSVEAILTTGMGTTAQA